MTSKSFAELTKQVHQLNDLILSDMICGNVDYSEEFLDFSHHLFATKYWFVRISWANKRRYVLGLLQDVKSVWTLSLLLKSLWNCRPKDAVLSANNQPHPWSVYDQVPLDHNRTALPTSILAQVMINDRKWFLMLDPESQALVLSELLTIAGGPIMWEALHRGKLIFERHREQELRNLLDCIVIEEVVPHYEPPPPPPPPPVIEKKVSKPSFLSMVQTDAKATSEQVKKDKAKKDAEGFEEEEIEVVPELPDTNAPEALKNLEEQLYNWGTLIRKIRASQKLEELEMTFKNGTKQTIWKVNRILPGAIETVDLIQLLPSAIAKRILSYLPKTILPDCAKVNKYWFYLVEELKLEQAARAKINQDLSKLRDLMMKYDTSLEVLVPSGVAPYAFAASIATSAPSSRRVLPSYRASEKSTGGVSFRHLVVEKLRPSHKTKPKPIQRLADLDDRLEQRGAADENLWDWCSHALKYWKGPNYKGHDEEGVLLCGDMHFPCPLMKNKLELPMRTPLAKDPSRSTAGISKERRNLPYGSALNLPGEPDMKRFSLWSRDFSSLYKVFKVASYQYPV